MGVGESITLRQKAEAYTIRSEFWVRKVLALDDRDVQDERWSTNIRVLQQMHAKCAG